MGRGASWAAAGMLAPVHELEFQELELLHAGREALLTYEKWAEELPDFGYQACGALEIALTRNDIPMLKRLYDFQQDHQLPVQWLEGSELRNKLPELAHNIRAGIWAPEDRQIDPRKLIQALLEALAVSDLVSLLPHEKQIRWQKQNDQSWHVRTERSEYTCKRLVFCTGVGHNVLFPDSPLRIQPVRGQMVSVLPPVGVDLPFPLRIRNRQYGNAYVVPKNDRWILGSTSEEKGFDSRPTAGGLLDILNKTYAALPLIYEQPVLEVWAGLRPAAPHRRPVVAEVEKNLWLFNGLYRHGILLGPYVAEGLAEWIRKGKLPDKLLPFATV